MKNQKIIISGPPGSGKTEIIKKLDQKGFQCFFEVNPTNTSHMHDQVISDKIIRNHKQILSLHIFNTRKEQYCSSIIKKGDFTFYDRSMIDVVAYLDYWMEEYPDSWDKTIEECRYANKVFYTPNWKEIYVKSPNRHETFTEAKLIDLVLRKTYLKFNYKLIEVHKLAVKERVEFILNHI